MGLKGKGRVVYQEACFRADKVIESIGVTEYIYPNDDDEVDYIFIECNQDFNVKISATETLGKNYKAGERVGIMLDDTIENITFTSVSSADFSIWRG